MKLSGIFSLFALNVIVKGAWWAAAVQPVILTLGAIQAALSLNELDIQSIEWKNFLPFKPGDDPEKVLEKDIEEIERKMRDHPKDFDTSGDDDRSWLNDDPMTPEKFKKEVLDSLRAKAKIIDEKEKKYDEIDRKME